MGPIRILRNRVFHHERITHYPLPNLHRDVFIAIGWINPQLLHLAEATNRFDAVFRLGWRRAHRDLMEFSYSEDYCI
jgi:hypothetical protein